VSCRIRMLNAITFSRSCAARPSFNATADEVLQQGR
jgi:hypothetical protein